MRAKQLLLSTLVLAAVILWYESTIMNIRTCRSLLGGLVGADSNGSLSFRDGILVRALRRGHWVILDELNLAPSEVFEALNRLLDDNRELYLPEINETVKPHPNLRLFATQNPKNRCHELSACFLFICSQTLCQKHITFTCELDLRRRPAFNLPQQVSRCN